jgi:hypothetical protein
MHHPRGNTGKRKPGEIKGKPGLQQGMDNKTQATQMVSDRSEQGMQNI